MRTFTGGRVSWATAPLAVRTAQVDAAVTVAEDVDTAVSTMAAAQLTIPSTQTPCRPWCVTQDVGDNVGVNDGGNAGDNVGGNGSANGGNDDGVQLGFWSGKTM